MVDCCDGTVCLFDESSNRVRGRVCSSSCVELREGVVPESEPIPWAVSKWADWTGEVLHSVHDHPYQETFGAAIQYWTDRPTDAEE